MTCIPTRHDDTVLAGAKAKPSGWPSANLDPGCGRRRSATIGSSRFQDQIPINQVSTVSGDCRVIIVVMLIAIATARGSSSPLAVTMRILSSPNRSRNHRRFWSRAGPRESPS
jgi:hypothetical protein